MSNHFTVPFSAILATPGVPLSYGFWQQVRARCRKMKLKVTAETVPLALKDLRREAEKRLSDAEKARQDAVRILNDCRAVERDVAVLMGLDESTIKAKRKGRR